MLGGGCSGPTEGDPAPTSEVLEQVVAGPRWQQVVEARAAQDGVPIPQDKPVRLVNAKEADATTLRCMEELGFATRTSDFGPGTEVEGGSKEELDAAGIRCLSRYPLRADVLNADMSEAELRTEYEWLDAETIPCLQRLGLDTSPLPPFADFVAGFRAGEPLWFPGDYTAAQRGRINESCDLLPDPKGSS